MAQLIITTDKPKEMRMVITQKGQNNSNKTKQENGQVTTDASEGVTMKTIETGQLCLYRPQ